MLGQSDEVRTSYVREVLQPALTPPDPPSPDPGPLDGISAPARSAPTSAKR